MSNLDLVYFGALELWWQFLNLPNTPNVEFEEHIIFS